MTIKYHVNGLYGLESGKTKFLDILPNMLNLSKIVGFAFFHTRQQATKFGKNTSNPELLLNNHDRNQYFNLSPFRFASFLT